MILRDIDWQKEAGATSAEISDLIAASEFALPNDYLSFLRLNNGGQGPLSVQPLWLVLDDAVSVAKTMRENTFTEFFPGLVVIGSNGAGEGIAFDFRHGAATKIVYFDMVNSDLDESIQPLATSFSELLSYMDRKET